jgi:hypothetical protein
MVLKRLAGLFGPKANAPAKPRPKPDLERRDALVDKIRAQGFPVPPEGPYPVVSLEDFFEGNTQDDGSIASNLPDHPGGIRFYEILRAIRERANVQDVLIEIKMVEDDDPNPQGWWPYSDGIFILTSASRQEVEDWLTPIQPDEIHPDHRTEVVFHEYHKQPAALPAPLPGYSVYYAWWD